MSKKKNDKKVRDGQISTNAYHVDGLAKLPLWFKCQFIKFWVGSASFFLTFMTVDLDFLDQLVVLLLIFTLATEFVSNLVIRQMALSNKDANYYLPHFIRSKSVFSMFATLLFCGIIEAISVLILSKWVSLGLPTLGNILGETELDPFSFGFIYLLLDYIYRRVRLLFYKEKEINKNDIT
ncbi:MAG: hypothetical protein LBV58_02465 [Acholeplasmatales bacterium]|jgi:hypothetical protein|nr:hypothetical protein [Acholeplasmatales bacterium]